MKIKSTINILLALGLFVSCSGTGSVNTGAEVPLTDVLTLELSFGDKDLPDEFLLVNPRSLAVDGDNNILVVDENSIKVYDEKGKEKTIVGRQGQGPGEFRTAGAISVGPSGLIAVGNRNVFNMYSGDLAFIGTAEMVMPGTFTGPSVRAVALSADEMVVDEAVFLENDDGKIYYTRNLLHKKGDSVTKIASYRYLNNLSAGGTTMSFSTGGEGEMIWRFLQGRRVLYVHTATDVSEEDGKSYYSLHFYSLDTEETEIVKREYIPVPLSDTIIKSYSERQNEDRIGQLAWEIVSSQKNNASLQNIYVDGERIFCFTRQKNNNGEVLFHIFDSTDGQFIQSAWFPEFETFPNLPSFIANGKVYRIIRGNRDEFARIEVYRFDPAVYRRKKR